MVIHQKDTIGLIGFSSTEQTMLELFFNGRQQKLFTLTPAEKASSLLVDLSSATGEMKYLKHQRLNPSSIGLSGIAITNGDDAPEGYLALKRPLTLNALSDALTALSKRLQEPKNQDAEPAPDRQTVFAEWQARKQAGAEAMQKWNQGKRLHDESKKIFPLDRHGVQEVISKAHLVMAHRRNEVTPGDPAIAVVSFDKDSAAVDKVHADQSDAPNVNVKAVQKPEKLKSVAGILRSNKAQKAEVQQKEIPSKDQKAKPTENSADVRLHDYCGHLPDQDLSDPSGLRRVRFNLERCLLPWVEQAVKVGRQSQQSQQVLGLPGVLIYLPSLDSFFCDLDEDLLLHMARAKFSFGELSLTAIEFSEAVINETSRHIVADKLVWKLALLTSRGRISESIDLNKPLQLIRKPDFNYFEIIPHARTLSELWYSKRLSPIQMLSESSLPQRNVFTFLVAADAVGYFNP
ncbi:MAG: hypothetical protein EA373_01080 [Oceanospirillales bacterium]|nr:MAG: hypothetical protein EA373_01080 [Oceanospirillales bacterium]